MTFWKNHRPRLMLCRGLVVPHLLLASTLALSSCAVVGHVTQLDDDYYRVVRRKASDSLVVRLPAQLYVQQRADTLLLTPDVPAGAPVTIHYHLRPDRHLVLLRRRLDLDVFTIPFKVRPPQGGVPVQLNTNFNAAIYVGRRLDFYSLRTKRSTPFGPTAHIRATGLGYGAFVGAGSTFITADVTGPRPSTTEYEGVVLHGGLATIYDARAFNIGVAAGIDQLLGPDGSYWVYQHKPWFGVLFGLDLN
ncbi:hypothetical protein [Hymenobacter negativus]|uniref:DUF2846 domain-containing protein n=1 Tax=Hymenobacter negativus TaxID=2795026 RepID=A0ABS3QBH5_9BACT|nr:hypothetical protein [Hymenobacter negativus]MBO2008606.1 hypothetical protein [Hymenobacter negativus]